MELDTPTIILVTTGFILWTIFVILLTKWILGMDVISRNLKRQSAYLKKIAEKQGVSEHDVNVIESMYEN